MKRPLLKRFVRGNGEEITEYKQGGEGSWAPNPLGALPCVNRRRCNESCKTC